MKPIYLGFLFIALGIAVFVAETILFGLHLFSHGWAESACDMLYVTLFIAGSYTILSAKLIPINSMQNITFLDLRKENGLWVFDDPEKDLKSEPFVEETTALLDLMVRADAKGSPTPTLAFSLSPHGTFTALEFVREENGGAVYRSDDRFGNREAWLCPQFWKYFLSAPKTIYARAFPPV